LPCTAIGTASPLLSAGGAVALTSLTAGASLSTLATGTSLPAVPAIAPISIPALLSPRLFRLDATVEFLLALLRRHREV